MTDTEIKVQNILQEIETGEKSEHLSSGEIAERLLGRVPGSGRMRFDTESSIDRELLDEQIKELNEAWDIPYYRPILVYRKRFHRLSSFLKRLVRRLLKFLLLPMLEEQVAFNRTATDTFNALYSDTVSLDHTLHALQRTVLEQQRQIEQLQEKLGAEACGSQPDAEDGKAGEEA